MSKSIAIVAAGAPATLLKAAASIVAKATGGAVATTEAATAAKNSIVVGSETPHGVYASVTRPPNQPNAAYAGIKTTVVRAILPRAERGMVQLRDIVDVYASAGIDCAAESDQAAAAFEKAGKLAAQQAKEHKLTRVTLVVKQAKKYQHLNALFLRAAGKAVEGAGLSYDVMSTAKAANELVMFPEKLGVVLVNDDPVCENLPGAFAGVTGGAHTTYYTEAGECVPAGAGYKSVALAIAAELEAMGMKAEAAKIVAAAQKSPRDVASAI